MGVGVISFRAYCHKEGAQTVNNFLSLFTVF